MSFPKAIPHLQNALLHAQNGNAAKAMHHVGHALFHLKGMTSGAGNTMKLPPEEPMATAPSPPAMGGTIIPPTHAPVGLPAPGPVGGEALRARLMGLGK